MGREKNIFIENKNTDTNGVRAKGPVTQDVTKKSERQFLIAFCFAVLSVFFSLTSWAIVDMKNANYSNTWVDIEIPGSGYDLKVSRTYNSRSLFNGIFGFGWCSDFETKLDKLSDGNLKITECGSGQETIFNKLKPEQGVATFQSASNGADIISFEKNQYIRKLPDGMAMKFNSEGYLEYIYDKNSNYLKFEIQAGLARSVVDNNGRKLNFTYTQNRKIKSIKGPSGISADYTYSNLEDLSLVKNSWGNVYKYEYDELHNLVRADYPDKTFVKIEYNKNKDWVTSFKDRQNCMEDYKYDFSKTEPALHYWADITKTCGDKITNQSKHEFWFKKRASGEAYLSRVLSIVNNSSVDISYHETFGKPVSIRRDNELSTYEYSAMGQVVQKKLPYMIIGYQYDKKNNKVTRVETQMLDAKGKLGKKLFSEFKYDNRLNLILARDTSGKVVQMNYDEKGRIIMVQDQSRKLVKIKYEEKFGKPSEIDRPGMGKVVISYKATGEIDKVKSNDGPTVAMQVASTFNGMLETIAPATAEIYN